MLGRAFPDSPSLNRFWGRIGYGGLLLFCLSLLPGKFLSNVAMLLMLAALLGMRRDASDVLRRDPVLALLLLWVAYVWARAAAAAFEFPGSGVHQIDTAREMTRALMILLVGWWVASAADARRVLLVFLAGTLMGAAWLLHENWETLWLGPRLVWPVDPQQAGWILVLAMLAWLGSLVHIHEAGRWRGSMLRNAASVMAGLVLLHLLIRNQGRAAWIAAVVAGLVWVLMRVAETRRSGSLRPGIQQVTMALLVTLVVGAMLVPQLGGVRERFAQDVPDGVHAGAVSQSSVGLRWVMWRRAGEMIAERPWFGWGPGSTPRAISTSTLPEGQRHFDHVHNTVLELLLRLGVIGLGIGAAVVFAIGVSFLRARRDGRVPWDLWAFGWCGLAVLGVAGSTDTLIDLQRGWDGMALVLGTMYGLSLRRGGPASSAR